MADRFMSAPTIHPAIPMSGYIREPRYQKERSPTGSFVKSGFRHIEFSIRSGNLSKPEAYRWVADKFCLTDKQAHIGQFSNYMCDQLIRESADVLKNNHIPFRLRAAS